MQGLFSMEQLELGSMDFDYQAFLLIFVLASFSGYLLSRFYFLYFRENEPQDVSLARSLVIITPALATLFWLIQHQLSLSLGLLGSLAVIRFRSPVKRAEDIAFILLAITFSIIMSLQAWFIAATLTIAIFAFGYLRNIVSVKTTNKGKFAILTINSAKLEGADSIAKLMKEKELRSECVSVRAYDGIISYVFNVTAIRLEQQDQVIQHISAIDPASQINFYYPNERVGA
jgi:hypothetical protein